ncbi:MAG: adenylate/guanylate cyclase domain-containing protein [Calditrichia bacterium]
MIKKKSTSLLILAAGVFLFSFIIDNLPQFRSLELKTIDWRIETRGKIPVDDLPIIIVTIDDISFGSLPDRWPWPRSYYAHAVKNALDAGAKVVGVDVILDKPDPYRPEYDKQFVDVLQKYHDQVVLVGKVVPGIEHVITPAEHFLNTGTPWGTVGLQAAFDGFYRQYLFGSPSKVPVDTIYPSFGAQILKIFHDYPLTEPINFDQNKMILGDITIPEFSEKRFLINFFGPAGTFPYVPFVDVIDDSTLNLGDEDLDEFYNLKTSGIFKDKIVLIGATITELHDNFATPFLTFTTEDNEEIKREMPGVEIHANALATILTGRFITPLPFAGQLLISLLFLVISIFIALKLRTTISAIALIGLLIGYSLVNYLLFTQMQLYLEFVLPIVNIIIGYFATSIYLYVITQREKQVILGAFTHYVPPGVVDEIIKDPNKLALGGEEREITIVFTDIANFTTISEKIEPKRLVSLINDYLTEMTDVVLANDGIIDKYEGDAIMAEFGAPVFYPDHAVKACKTAIEMQTKLIGLRNKWLKQGFPEIHTRIGINTGNVIIGNMGSRDVFDYTAMGDSVNLAARLESANKGYGTNIMISEFTKNQVADQFWCRVLDVIKVKGKEKPVKVYELIARKDEKIAGDLVNFISVFEKGFNYYLQREWDKALECFHYCVKYRTEDRPSAVYLRRIYQYKKSPPPENWDGVFIFTEK